MALQRNNDDMRIILVILFISCYLPFAYAVSEVDDRRIEEEKRQNLKATEARFYSEVDTQAGRQFDSTKDFLEHLASKKTASHEDAAKVLSIFLGKEDELTDFEALRQFLIDSNLLSKKKAEDFQAGLPLRRGLFAQILVKVLDIPGGLTLRVVGPFERYALAELVYEGIMISGSTREWMSGRELTFTFIQAAEFISGYRSSP